MKARSASVAMLALAVLAGACGVKSDERPRDVPPDQRALLDDNTPTSETQEGTRLVRLYFLSAPVQGASDRLQPSMRVVAGTTEAIVQELIGGLGEVERGLKLRTAIPTGTGIRSVSTPDGTAVVDLDSVFFKTRGDQQLRAVAQIVFTMTALQGIREVRLLIDGSEREWARADGTLKTRLSRSDFPELNPTTQPDYLPVPSPSAPVAAVPTTSDPTTSDPTTSDPTSDPTTG
jgi:spore germination protein GerM